VEQLLRLAQLAPEAPRGEMRRLDVAALAREVVGSVAPRARNQGIDLGADAPEPAPIVGARAELHSLITNLVDNALRYAPRDTEVTVKVQRDADAIGMSVVDAGPGIPAPDRERVFERFQRAPGDDTPGIGLGLAIVKAIVERHGGRIRLEDARPGHQPPGLAARIVFPGAHARSS
jgi:signal transduction histidine kinase